MRADADGAEVDAVAADRWLETRSIGKDITARAHTHTLAHTRTQVKLKEETIVAHDLLRLECKKLRDILNEKADQARRRSLQQCARA